MKHVVVVGAGGDEQEQEVGEEAEQVKDWRMNCYRFLKDLWEDLDGDLNFEGDGDGDW